MFRSIRPGLTTRSPHGAILNPSLLTLLRNQRLVMSNNVTTCLRDIMLNQSSAESVGSRVRQGTMDKASMEEEDVAFVQSCLDGNQVGR